MVDKKKVGIVTTVFNPTLYERSKEFFPEGIKLFTINGTGGFYGLKSLLFAIEELRSYNLDWLIMADEDVVFTKPENVFSLINFMAEKGFTVGGMRDGGEIKWRNNNPHVINHFFAILNLRDIYTIYNRNEILNNQYIKADEFPELNNLKYNNSDINSLFENYYCFYLWLLRNGKKFYYINATNPMKNDYATTALWDNQGESFLYHTWYARFYNKNKFHTERIDRIIKLGKLGGKSTPPIKLNNHLYDIKTFFYKYYRRVLRRVNK